MMRQKPCPYRIVDDLGGGFAMGCLLGGVFHFLRGMYYSPKSQKFYGGIMMMKKRGPILAGSFAMWAGIFSITDCSLIALRNRDDGFNKIAAGAITGGTLAFRAGPRIAWKNALFGGIFLAAIVFFDMFMQKHQKRQMIQAQNEFAQKQNKVHRKEMFKQRPDLFTEDGKPRIIPSPKVI